MERIIGIDYGRKRVGVAVSDPLGIFASALDTVPAAKIIDYLKNYTQNNKVARFVVGYPMNLNGRPAECAQYVDVFLKHLKKQFPDIPVHLPACHEGHDCRGYEEAGQEGEGECGQDKCSHNPAVLHG